MRIDKLYCRRFAGLDGREIAFTSGLNVLLGPNEAGKSTLVESILATLFQNHRLSGRSRRDKEFAERFFPHPDGDHAEVQLIARGPKGDVRIHRCWSFKAPFAELEQEGRCIRDDGEIEERLKVLLGYGEGTYAGVVFARQNDIRSIFQRISQEEGLSENVGAVLRRAVMEMDGVNVDRLARNIDERLLAYSERWDSAGERPEGNRGLENPFKKGVGKVLEGYYEMEGYRAAMLSAGDAEDRLARETDQLHELTGKLQAATMKLSEFSGVEPTLVERAELVAKGESLKKEQAILRELATAWPEADIRRAQAAERLELLNSQEEALQKRIENARRAEETQKIRQQVEKYDALSTERIKTEKEKSVFEKFQDDAILKLRGFQKVCDQCSAALEAATLIGRVDHASAPVTIVAGLSEPVVVRPGDSFQANGFLRLSMGAAIQMEVRSGEIDFESVRRRYEEAGIACRTIFDNLGISTLEEAEAGNRELKRTVAELRRISEAMEGLAGTRDMEILRKEMISEDQQPSEKGMEISVLEKQLTEVRTLKTAAHTEFSCFEGLVEGWVRQYDSRDRMLDAFGEASAEMKAIRARMEGLPSLPEEYPTIQMFQEEISRLRREKEALAEQTSGLHRSLDSLRERMSGLSAEELKKLYLDAEKNFLQRKFHMERLQVIRDTLREVRSDVDKRSFEPLEEKFAGYLDRLTGGKYQEVSMSADYGVELTTTGGKLLPSRLFSAGTLDAAALAFKFALLDLLFPEGDGLVVLDDCLVNLDPSRQIRAAELIREYACRHQVIFTTCSPEVAKLLDGDTLIVGR